MILPHPMHPLSQTIKTPGRASPRSGGNSLSFWIWPIYLAWLYGIRNREEFLLFGPLRTDAIHFSFKLKFNFSALIDIPGVICRGLSPKRLFCIITPRHKGNSIRNRTHHARIWFQSSSDKSADPANSHHSLQKNMLHRAWLRGYPKHEKFQNPYW